MVIGIFMQAEMGLVDAKLFEENGLIVEWIMIVFGELCSFRYGNHRIGEEGRYDV
jgi:hypothetical protein